MLIKYATAHKWEKSVIANPAEHFGKNSAAKIRSLQNKIDSFAIKFEIKEVDNTFFDWFLPKYESKIKEKKNPNIFDIRSKIKKATKSYYFLSIIENKKNVGATIFSIYDNNFSFAHKTYEDQWFDVKSRASPSLYAEYLACEYAYKIGCKTILHGRDRNPYGPNSDIGLAISKLAMGCQPKKSKKLEIETIETDEIEIDSLFFEYPGDNQIDIKKGYLITTKEHAHKWLQVTKYPHLVEINIIYRD